MRALLLAIAAAVLLAGCPTAQPKPSTTAVEKGEKKPKKKKKKRAKKPKKKVARATVEVGHTETGQAVWYGGKHHGGPTASGERFNKHKLTAAHRTLPFGTRVRVTNQRNGKSVVVRITDRGPFGKKRRIIDVSEAAARKLDFIERGVTDVTIEVIEGPE